MRVRGSGAAAAVMLALAACGGGSDDKASGNGGTATTVAAGLTSKQVFDKARPATVALYGRQGESTVGGTGVIFDAERGLILTNAHVVGGVAALKARINDETEIAARVLASAPCDDVAVVELTTVPGDLVAVKLGSSAGVENQDEVTALGYPASFADPATQKIVSTIGTVQSPDVVAVPDDGLPRFPSTIQHSATINPGNSGGPLLNDRAELVGLNTLRNVGGDNDVQGQYYAISIDHIKTLLPDLEAGTSRANMGWDIAPFSQVPLSQVFENTGYGTAEEGVQADQLLAENGVDGLFVFGVEPNSPAAEANLEGGDLITAMKGTPVTSVPEACDVLLSASRGETLALEGRYLTSGGPERQFGEQWRTNLVVK